MFVNGQRIFCYEYKNNDNVICNDEYASCYLIEQREYLLFLFDTNVWCVWIGISMDLFMYFNIDGIFVHYPVVPVWISNIKL